MSLRAVFAGNIKFYRKKASLSQQQLAERCGIATNYLSEIETGRKFPSVEMIETLSSALAVSACLLFLDGAAPAIDTELVVKKRNEEFSRILLKNVTDLLREYGFMG